MISAFEGYDCQGPMVQVGSKLYAATNKGGAGGAVVRLAKWPCRPVTQWLAAGNRLYCSHLQRFGMTQRWQQPRQTAGQQGLAGAGRATQQQVVLTCRGHQQGTLGRELALYLAQVGQLGRIIRQTAGMPGCQRIAGIQVINQLLQILDGIQGQARYQGRFFGIGGWYHQATTGLASGQCCWKYTPDWPYLPGQTQITQ